MQSPGAKLSGCCDGLCYSMSMLSLNAFTADVQGLSLVSLGTTVPELVLDAGHSSSVCTLCCMGMLSSLHWSRLGTA